jgi:hypothetical protein
MRKCFTFCSYLYRVVETRHGLVKGVDDDYPSECVPHLGGEYATECYTELDEVYNKCGK